MENESWNHIQLANNDAVNRLAMMSVILGIGVLVTGYLGMNIPHLATLLQNGAVSTWSLFIDFLDGAASLWFIVYIVGSNWLDYRPASCPTVIENRSPALVFEGCVVTTPLFKSGFSMEKL